VHISAAAWAATVALIAGLLMLDWLLLGRRPHKVCRRGDALVAVLHRGRAAVRCWDRRDPAGTSVPKSTRHPAVGHAGRRTLAFGGRAKPHRCRCAGRDPARHAPRPDLGQYDQRAPVRLRNQCCRRRWPPTLLLRACPAAQADRCCPAATSRPTTSPRQQRDGVGMILMPQPRHCSTATCVELDFTTSPSRAGRACRSTALAQKRVGSAPMASRALAIGCHDR